MVFCNMMTALLPFLDVLLFIRNDGPEGKVSNLLDYKVKDLERYAVREHM
jgi:hypothetical protein